MKVIKGFLAVCLLLALFIAALPTLLSTSKGTQWLTQQIENALQVKVELKSLQLGWIGEQSITGLNIEKPGQYHLHLDRGYSSASLLRWFCPGISLGILEVDSPVFEYELPADYHLNHPSEPLNKEKNSSSVPLFLLRPLEVKLNGGHISCRGPDFTSELQKLSLYFHLQGANKPVELDVKGFTSAGKQEGLVHLQMMTAQAMNPLPTLVAHLDIEHFPLEVLSGFVPHTFVPALQEWAQKPLELKADFQQVDKTGKYELHIDSLPLKASIKLRVVDNNMTLIEPAQGQLQLSSHVGKLLALDEVSIPMITSGVKAQWEVSQFEVSLTKLRDWKMRSNLKIDTLTLTRAGVNGSIGPLQASLNRQDKIDIQLRSLAPQSSKYSIQAIFSDQFSLDFLQTMDFSVGPLSRADLALWIDLPTLDEEALLPVLMSGHVDREGNTLKFKTQMNAPKLQMNSQGVLKERQFICQDLQLELDRFHTDDLDCQAIKLRAKDLLYNLNEPWKAFSGKIDLQVPKIQRGNLSIENVAFALKAQNSQMDIDLNSSIAKVQGRIALDKEGITFFEKTQLQLQFTKEELNKLLASSWIGSSPRVELEIEPMQLFFLKPFSAAHIQLKGICKEIAWQSLDKKIYPVGDLHIEVEGDLGFNVLTANLQSLTHQPGAEEIYLQAIVEKTNLKQIDLHMAKVPLQWVDAFVGEPQAVTGILGSSLDVQTQVQFLEGKPIKIGLDVKTPTLKTQVKTALSKESTWLLEQPCLINYTWTNDSYQFLSRDYQVPGDRVFILQDPLEMQIRLLEMEIDTNNFLEKSRVYLTAQLPKLQMLETISKRGSFLQDVELTLEQDPVEHHLAIFAKGRAGDFVSSNEFAVELDLKDIWQRKDLQSEPYFSLDQAVVHAHLQAIKFPSDLVDALARAFHTHSIGYLVCGPDITMEFDGNFSSKQGPVQMALNSQGIKVAVNGRLDGGALRLNEPIKGHLALSRSSCQKLFTDLYFLEPIFLEISDKQFFMPLFPLKKEQIYIEKIHLEVGKLECQNKGPLSLALGLLKWKNLKREKILSIWTLPIDMYVRGGGLTVQRTDFLVAEVFPLALWGRVDFMQDRVDMTLGITRSSLDQAFGLGDLPEDYMTLLPIQGTMASPGLDTTTATAKIAILAALKGNQVMGILSASNPTTFALHQLVSKVVTLPDQGKEIPASRYPIPWKQDNKQSK